MSRPVVTMTSHGCAMQKKSNANQTIYSIRSPHCRMPWQIVASTRMRPTKRIRWNRVSWRCDRAVWIAVVYWIAIDKSATAKVVVPIRCKNRHHRRISPNYHRKRTTCITKTAEAAALPQTNIRITLTSINVQKHRKYFGSDRTSRTGTQIRVIAPIIMREVAKTFVCWNTTATIIIGGITITIVATAMECLTWPSKSNDRQS